MSLRLADLPDGAHATVCGVMTGLPDLEPAHLRRLGELGFLPGEPVQLLRRGPGGREPLAVAVGDTVFALRLAEARCIEVSLALQPEPSAWPASEVPQGPQVSQASQASQAWQA